MPDTPDAVLDGLDPEQREVATALHGPVCVLAGAGTGKTRAITHRIAYGVRAGILQPASVLAVTFTARAAGRCAGGCGSWARAASRRARSTRPRCASSSTSGPGPSGRGAAPGGAQGPTGRRGRRALRTAAGPQRTPRCHRRDRVVEGHADRPRGLSGDRGQVGPEAPRPAEISRVYGVYEQLKRDRGVIDFEDVLLLTVGVLQERPDIADQVRGQYQHFVVDEYQDVSPLQQRLLELWLGDRENLCVVGDAGQTIYSFAGATPITC
ncbi:ATP-dependent helicase [Streptomyces sp. M19]